jgi:fatty acid desaturase
LSTWVTAFKGRRTGARHVTVPSVDGAASHDLQTHAGVASDAPASDTDLRASRRLGLESQRVPPDIIEYIRQHRLTEVSAAHSTRRAISAVLLYGALATLGVWADHLAVWCAIWGVLGFLMIGSAAGMHEGVHSLLYKTRWLNDAAASVWAAVLLIPFETWRRFHLAHHRAVSTPDDPEPRVPYANIFQYLLIVLVLSPVFVIVMWACAVCTVLGFPPAFARSRAARRAAALNLCFMCVWAGSLIAATVSWPGLLLQVFWVPWQCGLVLVTLATAAEHYGCKPGPDSAFVTTRTTTSNAVVRWFFWNSNYHGVHHLHAGVPSHRLPQLHERFQDRFEYVEPSYARWHLRLMASLLRIKAR